MTRTPGLLVAALVGSVALTGCTSQEDEYCAVLEEQSSVLTDLAAQSTTPGTDVLTPSLAAVAELRAAAPPELQDEWTTVHNAWQALADAVEAAGVPPEEYRPGTVPPGVRGVERRRLEGAATRLGGLPVLEAAGAVEEHALEVCDVDLGA